MRVAYRTLAVAVGLMLLLVGAACGGDDDSPSVADTVTLTPTVQSAVGTRLPTPTSGPNEIRPPELTMVTTKGHRVGIVAGNTWYDPKTGTFSGFEFSGRVTLATDPLVWPAGSGASFEIQATSPFPAGQTDIAIYRYDGNIVTPINPQGQVIGRDPTYVRQEPPVADLDLAGPSLTLANPLPTGTYIVDITIRWPVPPDIAQAAPAEPKTEYVFVVEVP